MEIRIKEDKASSRNSGELSRTAHRFLMRSRKGDEPRDPSFHCDKTKPRVSFREEGLRQTQSAGRNGFKVEEGRERKAAESLRRPAAPEARVRDRVSEGGEALERDSHGGCSQRERETKALEC